MYVGVEGIFGASLGIAAEISSKIWPVKNETGTILYYLRDVVNIRSLFALQYSPLYPLRDAPYALASSFIGSIDEIVSAADLCQSLIAEYKSAYNQASLDPYL